MPPEIIECFFLSNLYSIIYVRFLLDSKGKEKNMEILYIEDDIFGLVSETLANSSVSLSDDTLAQLKSDDAASVLAFLKEQQGAAAELSQNHREQTAVTLASFCLEKRKALEALFDELRYQELYFDENKSELSLFDLPAFSQQLIFRSLEIDGYDHAHSCDTFVLTRNGEKYVLEILQTDYSNDSMHLASVSFEDFDVLNECYNYFDAATSSHSHLAWSLVATTLQNLGHKYDVLGEEYLNQAERELLPLTNFYPIALFSGFAMFNPSEEQAACFSEIARASGGKKLVSLMKGTQSKATGQRVHQALQDASALPVWEYIHAKLLEATSPCPRRQDKQIITAAMRSNIEKAILASGFSGEYPHFYNTGDINGFRLMLVNGTPYIYTGEKNALSVIDIIETNTGIYFASGTILHKRVNRERLSKTSSLEAFFTDGGYRIGKYITIPAYELNVEGADANDLLAKAVSAVVKLSSLQKLAKQEQIELSVTSGDTASPRRVTILVMLFSGIFFGLFLCVGMAILGFIAGVILGGSIEEGARFIASVPWHRYFLFAAIAFGGVMSVIAALARDK